MQKIAYLFPGQGAQYVGMGKDLYEGCPASRNIFDEAEKILPDLNIKKLCFEGPIEELTRTVNSQVAILVTSIAALEALNSRFTLHPSSFTIVAAAGLSLGELTALVAARSIEFQDAVRLVRRRGELMEEASVKNPGAMASIIGLTIQDLNQICSVSGAEIANLNCPGQIVISGTKDSVESCTALATEKGAKKSIALKVNGPFHSSLMKGAAELFKIELEKVKFLTPQIPVISNVTADCQTSPREIKENLVRQLYSPVQWEKSVKKIADDQGVDTFFEIGPGKVLKGLLRRIDPNLKVFNIEKMEDVENLVTRNQSTETRN